MESDCVILIEKKRKAQQSRPAGESEAADKVQKLWA